MSALSRTPALPGLLAALLIPVPASSAESRTTVFLHSSCPSKAVFAQARLSAVMDTVDIEFDASDPGRGGDSALALDLNGDAVVEYFVPYDCGATGNCQWALLAGVPLRVVGRLAGKVLAIEFQSNGWPTIVGYSHMSVGSGTLEKYQFSAQSYSTVASSDELEGNRIHRYLACEDNPRCCP